MKDNENNNSIHRPDGEENGKRTLKRKRIVAIASVVIAVALFIWFALFISDTIKNAGGVHTVAAEFSKRINDAGFFGVFMALAVQVIQVIVSPIPGQVVEIVMGICYGGVGGALMCLLGSAIAAALIMMFVKRFGVKAVELFISTDKINELRFINNEKKLERTVFLLFVIPGTPKDPLIFFFGLTKMKTSTFVVIQTLARAPAMFCTTLGGKFLAEQNYFAAILIFAITGAIALVGMLCYNKFLAKFKERKEHKNEETEG